MQPSSLRRAGWLCGLLMLLVTGCSETGAPVPASAEVQYVLDGQAVEAVVADAVPDEDVQRLLVERTAGGATTVRLTRGAAGSPSPQAGRMLVLLEGTPATDAQLALVDATSLRRVEIVRGAEARALAAGDTTVGAVMLLVR